MRVNHSRSYRRRSPWVRSVEPRLRICCSLAVWIKQKETERERSEREERRNSFFPFLLSPCLLFFFLSHISLLGSLSFCPRSALTPSLSNSDAAVRPSELRDGVDEPALRRRRSEGSIRERLCRIFTVVKSPTTPSPPRHPRLLGALRRPLWQKDRLRCRCVRPPSSQQHPRQEKGSPTPRTKTPQGPDRRRRLRPPTSLRGGGAPDAPLPLG